MTNRVALVTGGSRGIGAAIAEQLAKDGFDIAFSYAKNSSAADKTANKIKEIGRKVLTIQANEATIEGNRKVISETIKHFGRLDALICNAGIYNTKTIDQVDIEDIENILNLNLRGVMIETHEAVLHMKAGSRIVLMGSAFAGRAPFPGISLYAATKASLRGFAQGVARDLGSKKITINVIEPGPIDTELNPADGEGADMLASYVAVGKYGHVQDIARAVSFLVHPDANYINGAAIPVDGGFLA